MAAVDFDRVVEQYHLTLGIFQTGVSEPVLRMFSNREDVTLANPFGPVARGPKQVADTAGRAADNYRDGEATGFETISKYVTPDLAYIVEVERYRSKVGGGEDYLSLALRVTSIFRLEAGTWKVVHRHADPITSPRPPESVIPK